MSDQRGDPLPFNPVGVLRWGWRMAEELARLPDAIAQWREGVALFLAVARRLESTTSSAEELLAQVEASGLLEQLERLQALSLEIGRQAPVGGTAVGGQVLGETRRNIEAFARLFTGPPPAGGD
jgi:hypothetical protein